MGDLEGLATDLFAALDRADVDGVMRLVADDAQEVHEMSRRWLRSASDIESTLRETVASLSEIASAVVDADERVYGEVGVLTFQLDQSFVADGERGSISAPSTMVFRRIDGEWKMILFHSVPLPD